MNSPYQAFAINSFVQLLPFHQAARLKYKFITFTEIESKLCKSRLSQIWENWIVLHKQLEANTTNNGQLINFYTTALKHYSLVIEELKLKALLAGQESGKVLLVPLHFHLLPLN